MQDQSRAPASDRGAPDCAPSLVFKRERPQSEVTVRDVRDNSITLIDGEFVAAFEISRKH